MPTEAGTTAEPDSIGTRPIADSPEVERVRAVLESRLLGGATQPARLGRFVLLERVGQGGMGVVYAAFDDRLDRKVAIKLLHAELDAPGIRERLVREAQAMARLSHPNVATVYEIGEHDGRALVAMEFVKGQTLRQWRAEGSRSSKDVLGVYLQAGRGLSAAHAAGIVHRDFKPDNALIGTDERVRVVDFGLARAADGRESDNDDEVGQTLTSGEPLATPLTRKGTRVGTPGYMAPEQIRGEPTDASTDQFAFCVALWEALAGRRPFTGTTSTEVFAAVLSGDVRSPPRSTMPAWIEAVLRRGLAVDPKSRHPSMTELLRALDTDPAVGRRRRWGLGVALLAGPALWLGLQARARLRADACAREAASVDAIWNADEATRVRDGLLASGAGNAATTVEKVTPRLADYAERWRSHSEQVCATIGADDDRDSELRARAYACLEDRQLALATLVELLASADRAVVQRAVTSTIGLPRPESCIDERDLSHDDRPEDPETLDHVRAVERELVAIDSLQNAGRFEQALAKAELALADAEAAKWRPTIAAAHFRIGVLTDRLSDYSRAEREYELAFHEAAAANRDALAARAAVGATWVVGYRQARFAEADRWDRLAETFLARLGDPGAELSGSHESTVAHIFGRRGRSEEALNHFERALELTQEALGEEHENVVSVLNGLAEVQVRSGRVDEARESWERARSIVETVLGADHSLMGNVLTGLAWTRQSRGDAAGALELHREALALREHAYGPDHVDVANSLINVADALSVLGQNAAAEVQLREAIAILERRVGSRDTLIATALGNLANLEYASGRYPASRDDAARALEIAEGILGPSHPETGRLLSVLSTAEEALGEYEASRAHAQRALAIVEATSPASVHWALNNLANIESTLGEQAAARANYSRSLALAEAALGRDSVSVAFPLTGLGSTSAELGDLDESRRYFERALAVREAALPTDHPLIGFSLVNLAQTEFRMGQHDLARPRLQRAIAIFEQGEGHPGLGYALTVAGKNELGANAVATAVAHLERALRLTEAAHTAGELTAMDLAGVRFALAQALIRTPGARRRAQASAVAAAATYRDVGAPGAKSLAEVERWLAQHGPRFPPKRSPASP